MAGYGIGLLAVDGLLGLLPLFKMDSIILNVSGMTSESGQDNHFIIEHKLMKYWSLLGFLRWSPPDAEFIIMGMWTGTVQPDIEDVCSYLSSPSEAGLKFILFRLCRICSKIEAFLLSC